MDLCPEVGLSTIHRVYKQIKEVVTEYYTKQKIMIQDKHSLYCSECEKLSEYYEDTQAGDIVCKECGLILNDHMLPNYSSDIYMTLTWYSKQDEMKSTLSGKGKLLHRLNNSVEENLNRYQKTNMVTGEYFKDEHRRVAYGLIEHISHKYSISLYFTQITKTIFNLYREKMSRLHRFKVIIVCCFMIAGDLM